MSFISNSDVDIWYETFGTVDDPLVVLIPQLGGQALTWDERFCKALSERSFHVVRFDLRDAGLSTKLDHLPAIERADVLRGDMTTVGYTLSDLAGDVAALIQALSPGRPSAHLVGMSLGGMVAQVVAVDHSRLVRSLVSISAAPSFASFARTLDESPIDIADHRRQSNDVEVVLEAWLDSRRAQASPAYAFDEIAVRRNLREMIERDWYPEGRQRQLAAVVAAGDRTAALSRLRLPALVVHGSDDPLIPVAAGIATAEAIEDSVLLVIDGMGHELPERVWPRVIDAIVTNAERAS